MFVITAIAQGIIQSYPFFATQLNFDDSQKYHFSASHYSALQET